MDPFLPSTLAGWLSLVSQFAVTMAAALAIAMRWIRTPLEAAALRDREDVDRRFKDHGERIGKLAQDTSSNASTIAAIDKQVEHIRHEQTTMAEKIGGGDARMNRMMEMVERDSRGRLLEDRNIGERLASIETQLRILIPGAAAGRPAS